MVQATKYTKYIKKITIHHDCIIWNYKLLYHTMQAHGNRDMQFDKLNDFYQ